MNTHSPPRTSSSTIVANVDRANKAIQRLNNPLTCTGSGGAAACKVVGDRANAVPKACN